MEKIKLSEIDELEIDTTITKKKEVWFDIFEGNIFVRLSFFWP